MWSPLFPTYRSPGHRVWFCLPTLRCRRGAFHTPSDRSPGHSTPNPLTSSSLPMRGSVPLPVEIVGVSPVRRCHTPVRYWNFLARRWKRGDISCNTRCLRGFDLGHNEPSSYRNWTDSWLLLFPHRLTPHHLPPHHHRTKSTRTQRWLVSEPI